MNELKSMLAYTNIDVERLVRDYTRTLHENNNACATEAASIIALKEWAQKKDYLIHQVMAMPGYNGNLQAIGTIEIPFERTTILTNDAISDIWKTLFKDGEKILSRVNDDGKTMEDLIKEELADLPDKINIKSIPNYSAKTKQRKSFTEFNSSGITFKSIKDKDNANRLISLFKHYTSTRLDDEIATRINNIVDFKASPNMKTTRMLGKILKKYGAEDKSAGSKYGELFIKQYCECIMREGGIKLTYVISVNPIDYLKMSIAGNYFTSCHNIRGGGWASGTISYMLDDVTLITYGLMPGSTITDPETGEIVTEKERPELFTKMYRNVIHWDKNHRLIQSRMYPQGKEGCVDLYKAFRLAAQEKISGANGWNPERWTNRKRKYMPFTHKGEGCTNYPDWSYENYGGNLSTPNRPDEEYSHEPIYIGAAPTCIICGEHHNRTNRLYCNALH